MLQIIKITLNDDSFASKSIEVMFCNTLQECEKMILKELNNDFEKDWQSLNDAIADLENDVDYCSYDETTFVWEDNGKGCSYIIGNIDIFSRKNEFQHFNVLID